MNKTGNPNAIGTRIINWLRNKGFIDTFRECYLLSWAYTWTNGHTRIWIDYIWLSNNWTGIILDVSIAPSQLITNSDHQIVRSLINTSDIIKGMNKQQEAKAFHRVVYEYDKATSVHWDSFTKFADELIMKFQVE